MDRVSELLGKDPIGGFYRNLAFERVKERFENYISDTNDNSIHSVFYPFVEDIPMRYWNEAVLDNAVRVLLREPTRTLSAFYEHNVQIDRGIRNLTHVSETSKNESSLSLDRANDLVQLATGFIPDYLRIAEHVFGNLISVYWSVLKRGNVSGKFDLRRASSLITSTGDNLLMQGFSEEVRNAIAHGEVSFTGFDIEFGTAHPNKYSASDFLRLYDDLSRTNNSLMIGLLIYWSRHKPPNPNKEKVPMGLITRFAAATINRPGIEILGSVISKTPLAGNQVHVAVTMRMLRRTQVLGDCARVAYSFYKAGIGTFDRLVIQLDHGEDVNSLAVIRMNKLIELADQDANISRLAEIYEDTQLLWFDENPWITRIKSWAIILTTGIEWLRFDILRSWRELGIGIGKGKYRIRQIEELGTNGISRIRIKAILRNPSDAKDRIVVNAVIKDIVSKYKSKYFRSRSRYLDRGIGIPKRPKYIFVDLFLTDGTLRWLKGGGWLGGNLVAVAEYVRNTDEYVLVDNPEQTLNRINIRYSIDQQKASQATQKFASAFAEILSRNTPK